MTALERWDSFYVIVGSSAGALIGLQFVVMTLIAERPVATKDAQAGAAFATPNVLHFGVVLFLTLVLYGNFAWFREQFCVVMCPYGRLQSVLLDGDSLVVGYDKRRGEPRGGPPAADAIDATHRRSVKNAGGEGELGKARPRAPRSP
jgi:hypothetical protein